LPKGCAVSSFNADVGDRHLVGKIQEKQKAEVKSQNYYKILYLIV